MPRRTAGKGNEDLGRKSGTVIPKDYLAHLNTIGVAQDTLFFGLKEGGPIDDDRVCSREVADNPVATLSCHPGMLAADGRRMQLNMPQGRSNAPPESYFGSFAGKLDETDLGPHIVTFNHLEASRKEPHCSGDGLMEAHRFALEEEGIVRRGVERRHRRTRNRTRRRV
jgi:hypothetical protein